MKEFIKKNTDWSFFVLAFSLSWLIWFVGNLILPKNLKILALLIGGFGPFAAAMLMVRFSAGRPALIAWLKSTFNFHIHVIWYLLGAMVLPFAIASVHHLLYIILGGKSGVNFNLQWLSYLGYLIPTTLLSGGNEEPGWRGYITPVLLQRLHPIVANVIVGVFWALWHLPLYFLQGWGGNNQPFIWLVLYAIPLSMILTWLYYRSKTSIIPVMLLHAGTNVVFQYFPMQTRIFPTLADEFTVIKTAVYAIFAMVLLIATKGRLGYQPKT